MKREKWSYGTLDYAKKEVLLADGASVQLSDWSIEEVEDWIAMGVRPDGARVKFRLDYYGHELFELTLAPLSPEELLAKLREAGLCKAARVSDVGDCMPSTFVTRWYTEHSDEHVLCHADIKFDLVDAFRRLTSLAGVHVDFDLHEEPDGYGARSVTGSVNRHPVDGSILDYADLVSWFNSLSLGGKHLAVIVGEDPIYAVMPLDNAEMAELRSVGVQFG
jgi:hypothetical protein